MIEKARAKKRSGRVDAVMARQVFNEVQAEIKNGKRVENITSPEEVTQEEQNTVTEPDLNTIEDNNRQRAKLLSRLLFGSAPIDDDFEIGSGPDSFLSYLQERLKEGYIDHVCPEMSTYQRNHSPPTDGAHPRVQKKISDPDSVNGQRYLVWLLLDVLSPEFEEKMWNERLNKQAFTRGKNGRESSFVRMFSETNVPLHMVIGKVDAYETIHGEALSTLDKDLLAAARYLANMQRDFVHERLAATEKDWDDDNPPYVEEYVTPIDVKIGHSVLATYPNCCYDTHDDSGQSVNNPKTVEWSEKRSLPTQGEQQTITMCSQNLPAGQAKITWYDGNGKSILEVFTQGRCWHWQSPLMQLYLKHKVEYVVDKSDPKREARFTKRMIVSFREANDPEADRAWYKKRLHGDARGKNRRLTIHKTTSRGEYNIFDVVEKVGDPRFDPSKQDARTVPAPKPNEMELDADLDTPEEDDWFGQVVVQRYNLSNPKYADKFKGMDKDEFEETGIKRPGLMFQASEPAGWFSGHVTMVTKLLELGLLVRTKRTMKVDGVSKEYETPSLLTINGNSFPIVGEDFDLAEITLLLGLKVNAHAHDPFNYEDTLGEESPGMMIHQFYKNMFDESVVKFHNNAIRYYTAFSEAKEKGDFDAAAAVELFPDNEMEWMLTPLCIGGNGASTQKAGGHAPQITGAKSNAAYATVYASQRDDGKMHTTFTKFTEQRRIVPIFLNPKTFYSKKTYQDHRPVFLGNFWFCFTIFGNLLDPNIRELSTRCWIGTAPLHAFITDQVLHVARDAPRKIAPVFFFNRKRTDFKTVAIAPYCG